MLIIISFRNLSVVCVGAVPLLTVLEHCLYVRIEVLDCVVPHVRDLVLHEHQKHRVLDPLAVSRRNILRHLTDSRTVNKSVRDLKQ